MLIGDKIAAVAAHTIDVWRREYPAYTFGGDVEAYSIVIIDADGCLVVPGFVDPHVHLDYPQACTVT